MSLPRCNQNGMDAGARDTWDYGPSLGQTESGSVELLKDFALRGAQPLNSKLVPMTLDRTYGLKKQGVTNQQGKDGARGRLCQMNRSCANVVPQDSDWHRWASGEETLLQLVL